MPDLRTVTPELAVAPQLAPEDMAAVRAAGFTTVVANRPDGEGPGQPGHAQLAAAAREAGLHYVLAPFAGAPPAAVVAALQRVLAEADGPVLAFCRSGTRSITAWALGELTTGRRSRAELVGLAAQAGYDLDAALPR